MFDPALQAARLRLGVSPMDLWTLYFGLGGNLDPITVDGYLNGIIDVSDLDHDVITQALNELHIDKGENHPLAYRNARPTTTASPSRQTQASAGYRRSQGIARLKPRGPSTSGSRSP